jgi:guanylate kinase
LPNRKSKRSGNRRRTSSKGVLFVVSAPSGAGKTTLVSALLRHDRKLTRTVSHTTRPPRRGEKSGRDYFFVSRSRFDEMIRRGAFVEWATAYGSRYGTSRKVVETPLRKGQDVVLVIESHGGRAIHRLYPGSVRILILPPDLATLRKRLTKRSGGDRTSLLRRLREARSEVRAMSHYDYVVVNDRLSEAVENLRGIVLAERARMKRRSEVVRTFLR